MSDDPDEPVDAVPPALDLTDLRKIESIRLAYSKHATELIAIDDQQQKLLLVLLGILGAGAAYLGKDQNLRYYPKLGLTLITLGLVAFWLHYTGERHRYRQSVRRLLVRCEMALGFFKNGAFLSEQGLYQPDELQFERKGVYLAFAYGFSVVLAALGFLMVLLGNSGP